MQCTYLQGRNAILPYIRPLAVVLRAEKSSLPWYFKSLTFFSPTPRCLIVICDFLTGNYVTLLTQKLLKLNESVITVFCKQDKP